MKLIHRYRQPKRSSEVQTVVVAGEHHVAALGKRIDLRSGEITKSLAARYAPDGAWVEWAKTGELFLVTPSGERTQLTGFEGLSTGVMMVGDEHVLLQADGRQPLLCIERKSGKPSGRLEEMKGERYNETTTLYTCLAFDPRDGHTVWLVEGGRLAHYDLATRRPIEVFEPKAGEKFLGISVHPDGWVITSARSLATPFDGSRDELVLIKDGKEVTRRPMSIMSSAPLQNGFVVFEPAAKRFVFLDFALKEIGALAHDSNWAQLLWMPSLREWITIGGHGEWDHHGENDLPQPAVAEEKKKKPAAKKAKPKAK
jgi:hypothetical protein